MPTKLASYLFRISSKRFSPSTRTKYSPLQHHLILNIKSLQAPSICFAIILRPTCAGWFPPPRVGHPATFGPIGCFLLVCRAIIEDHVGASQPLRCARNNVLQPPRGSASCSLSRTLINMAFYISPREISISVKKLMRAGCRVFALGWGWVIKRAGGGSFFFFFFSRAECGIRK